MVIDCWSQWGYSRLNEGEIQKMYKCKLKSWLQGKQCLLCNLVHTWSWFYSCPDWLSLHCSPIHMLKQFNSHNFPICNWLLACFSQTPGIFPVGRSGFWSMGTGVQWWNWLQVKLIFFQHIWNNPTCTVQIRNPSFIIMCFYSNMLEYNFCWVDSHMHRSRSCFNLKKSLMGIFLS